MTVESRVECKQTAKWNNMSENTKNRKIEKEWQRRKGTRRKSKGKMVEMIN